MPKLWWKSKLAKKNSSFTVPYEEFKEDDHEAFREALRVSVELFDELLDGIETDIAKRVGLHRIITLLCISLFFFKEHPNAWGYLAKSSINGHLEVLGCGHRPPNSLRSDAYISQLFEPHNTRGMTKWQNCDDFVIRSKKYRFVWQSINSWDGTTSSAQQHLMSGTLRLQSLTQTGSIHGQLPPSTEST